MYLRRCPKHIDRRFKLDLVARDLIHGLKIDGVVMPVKTGIHNCPILLDSGARYPGL